MKGILFKPDMIQAIIEGRKTQARRVIKPQPKHILDQHRITLEELTSLYIMADNCASQKARFQAGETVYIKEAWYADKRFDHLKPKDIPLYSCIGYPLRDIKPDWGGKLRSPMFLRQEFARYFLKILDVRAERLQEITLPDCESEGFALVGYYCGCPACDTKNHSYYGGRNHFKEYWNSINKDYPWESNPWVFTYTFKLKEMRR